MCAQHVRELYMCVYMCKYIRVYMCVYMRKYIHVYQIQICVAQHVLYYICIYDTFKGSGYIMYI